VKVSQEQSLEGISKKNPNVWQEAYNALQTMAGTCIVLRTNMTDVYIALRC
jgi:hypothetical protein